MHSHVHVFSRKSRGVVESDKKRGIATDSCIFSECASKVTCAAQVLELSMSGSASAGFSLKMSTLSA